MDIELLRDFLNIAYTKEFDWISKSRSMDRSSASRRMALLESTVGAKLFASKGKGKEVKLTEAGDVLFAAAGDICQRYDTARKNIAEVQLSAANNQNGIKFIAFHSIATTELPKFIQVLGENLIGGSQPFSASISTGSDYVPIDTLASNDTDFAVIYKPRDEPLIIPEELGRRFDSAMIGEDKLVPICHRESCEEFRKIIRSGNSKEERRQVAIKIPIIQYSPSTYLRTLVNRKLDDDKWRLNQCTYIAHDATMSHILLSMVRNKLGLAWVLESSIAQMVDSEANEICRFVVEEIELSIDVDIVLVRTTDRANVIHEKIWAFAKRKEFDIDKTRSKKA